MNNSLLPFNATSQERALAQATANLDHMPLEVGKLWDPDNCPAALLPWLAWAMSVDEWDSQWSEQTQRDLIKNAAYTHRQKGTVGAVKKALSSLGVTVDFLEWFEDVHDILLAPIHSKQPYTFVFIAWANENPYTSNDVFLNPQLYDAIERIVNQTKPVRSHFDFLVGAKLGSELSLGTASTGWSQVGRFCHATVPVQMPPSGSEVGVSLVSAGHHAQASRLCHQTVPVQVPVIHSTLYAALQLSRKGFAVGRFFMAV